MKIVISNVPSGHNPAQDKLLDIANAVVDMAIALAGPKDVINIQFGDGAIMPFRIAKHIGGHGGFVMYLESVDPEPRHD